MMNQPQENLKQFISKVAIDFDERFLVKVQTGLREDDYPYPLGIPIWDLRIVTAG